MSVRRDVPHYVYRCYAADGALLYIGCTNNPISRIRGHRKDQPWGDQIAYVRYTVFPDRRKALDVERGAIWNENPRYNIRRVSPTYTPQKQRRVNPPYILIVDIRRAKGDEFADRCLALVQEQS